MYVSEQFLKNHGIFPNFKLVCGYSESHKQQQQQILLFPLLIKISSIVRMELPPFSESNVDPA